MCTLWRNGIGKPRQYTGHRDALLALVSIERVCGALCVHVRVPLELELSTRLFRLPGELIHNLVKAMRAKNPTTAAGPAIDFS